MRTQASVTTSLPASPATPPTRRFSRFLPLSVSPARRLVLALAGIALPALFLLAPPPARANDVIRQYLADGFDFPVGKPDSYGYYKARGFWPNGHLGEDWNGRGGGNSDLGDPVYAIGRGIVVYSGDYRKGWGNVIIIRHAYRETNGRVHYVDSLYGHLDRRHVKLYQSVKRGQQVGTIGTNRGMYLAHLHFEIRKNLSIGMNRTKYSKGYANYHNPTDFIKKHRELRTGFRMHPVPVNTFDGNKSDLLTKAKTTIPVENPSSKKSSSTDPEVANNRGEVPDEVENVLKDYEKDEKTDTKGFWQRIKDRLSTRTTRKKPGGINR